MKACSQVELILQCTLHCTNFNLYMYHTPHSLIRSFQISFPFVLFCFDVLMFGSNFQWHFYMYDNFNLYIVQLFPSNVEWGLVCGWQTKANQDLTMRTLYMYMYVLNQQFVHCDCTTNVKFVQNLYNLIAQWDLQPARKFTLL